MQKKYNIQAKTLNLDNSTQTSINTYNQSIDLGDTRVSWDHPPFNPVNPSYNSCNSIHKPQQQHPPSLPRSPTPSAEHQNSPPPAQPHSPSAEHQNSPPLAQPQNSPPSQQRVTPQSPSTPAIPKHPSAQPQKAPLIANFQQSQNPSSPTSQVQSAVPSRRHTITTSNPSNQKGQRLSSVTLEQQLREAIQERFKNANPNSDDESNSDDDESNSDLSEEDF